MSLLARYVMRQVLAYTGMVMAVLLMLIALYLLVDESGDLGTGRYGMTQALVVVLCRLPGQMFMLLPIGALMGAMLALGNLARGSELIAMRSAGLSPARLAVWVACAGVLLGALTWALGDYIAPPAEQFASQYKRLARTNQSAVPGSENMWAKDGRTFVFVQKQDANGQLGGVYVLNFDESQRLLSLGKAQSAYIAKDDQWVLSDFVESRFTEQGVVSSRQDKLRLHTSLSSAYLGSATIDPDSLTGRALLKQIAYLEKNHLVATEYQQAFWTRVARTVALVVIVMLAVPFSFGPMRSSGTGARMVAGILVGAVFFLMAKLLSSGGTVYDIHPLVVAWAPTTLLAVVTWVAVLRVR